MKQRIYADNAATTKLDKEAFEAMIPWLMEEYGNPSQPYSFARPAKKALSDARSTIASCINAEPEEIFFTSGGTESDNWAIKGTAFAAPEKKQIITTPIEHHAVLNTCNSLLRHGYRINFLSVNKSGIINHADMVANLEKEPTSIVSIMMANNEIGTIQPFSSKTEEIIHQHGAYFHTDAVQAVGHIKIDVKELGADLLSASAHKFNGPKGIGFLYIKKGTRILPYANGGAQETGMRSGTENVASIVGMAVALKKNCDNISQNTKTISDLACRLLAGLDEAGIAYRKNSSGNSLPGLLSLSFPGFEGETILHRLDLLGISVSTGAACDSKNTKVSHVLQAIQLPEAYSKGTIRVSLGKDNTIDEINEIISSFKRILLR